jgi:hypothetical protein
MARTFKLVVFASAAFGLGVGIFIGVVLMAVVAAHSADTRFNAVGVKLPDAKELSAGQLAAFCRRPSDSVPMVFCDGFIAGVIGTYPSIGRCLPNAWSIAEARKTFLAWSDLHPQTRDNPASNEVIAAQPAIFHCGKNGHGG